MRYLIPLFDCILLNNNKSIKLCANVKYQVANVDNSNFFVLFNSSINVSYLNLLEPSNNIILVKHNNNEYIFLINPNNENCTTSCGHFKYSNRIVSFSLINNLTIFVDGKIVTECCVNNLTYSHFEIVGELCIIHFCGKRNFIVILNADSLCCASFYDEYNKNENEQLFMCRLCDSLNHGKVFSIKDKKFESYLVYLDDYELNLKPTFIGAVFLDCAKAGNYKYCNHLLIEDLKHNDDTIKNFLVEFDYYFPINEQEFILLKKNTLAGIYNFEYLENKIANIIQVDFH